MCKKWGGGEKCTNCTLNRFIVNIYESICTKFSHLGWKNIDELHNNSKFLAICMDAGGILYTVPVHLKLYKCIAKLKNGKKII